MNNKLNILITFINLLFYTTIFIYIIIISSKTNNTNTTLKKYILNKYIIGLSGIILFLFIYLNYYLTNNENTNYKLDNNYIIILYISIPITIFILTHIFK